MWTFRLSLGDFSAIKASKTLNKQESILFWVIWLLTCIITCIIFLNFVVAEACASYSKVKEYLDPIIQREKAILISECEDMIVKKNKTREGYPKFIIVRQTEI